MRDCFYCTKDQRLSGLMDKLCSLEWSDVYFLKDQRYRGRCVVAAKRHVDELYEMNDEEISGFFKDVALVAACMNRLYHTDKINYAVYGDLVSHFHIHLVPKHKSGPQWGEPFTDKLEKLFLSGEEQKKEILQFREELLNNNT